MKRRRLIPTLCSIAAIASIAACGSGQRDGENGQPGSPVAVTPARVESGRSLYRSAGCITCHTVDGRRSMGPTLLGLYGIDQKLDDGRTVKVDDGYIRRSMIDPNAEIAEGFAPGTMINYSNILTAEEINSLIAFIASLEAADQAAAPGSAEGAEDLGVREDGRPTWWFEGVRDRDSKVAVCGEGLGGTLEEARESATADARSQLRAHLGWSASSLPLDDESADLALVWPLPNPGGASRYAGYVLLSIPGTE